MSFGVEPLRRLASPVQLCTEWRCQQGHYLIDWTVDEGEAATSYNEFGNTDEGVIMPVIVQKHRRDDVLRAWPDNACQTIHHFTPSGDSTANCTPPRKTSYNLKRTHFRVQARIPAWRHFLSSKMSVTARDEKTIFYHVFHLWMIFANYSLINGVHKNWQNFNLAHD